MAPKKSLILSFIFIFLLQNTIYYALILYKELICNMLALIFCTFLHTFWGIICTFFYSYPQNRNFCGFLWKILYILFLHFEVSATMTIADFFLFTELLARTFGVVILLYLAGTVTTVHHYCGRDFLIFVGDWILADL